MAEINHTVFDRTLSEVDKIIEAERNKQPQRKYLGMSQIGDECQRKLWYTFRMASVRHIAASGLRAIEDGFDQEDKMAKRLKLLKNIQLYTTDPKTGKQIEFKFLDGHFSGHADGMIKGVIESPEKWHVWEHKSVNVEKFEKLKKLRIDKGEKNALIEWDYIYYCQAQIYMHSAKLDRHFLTVTSPGGREYISVRTEKKEIAITEILEKAYQIIYGKIPDRVSNKREFYLCKWCEHFSVCHDSALPLKNCGTCSRRTPLKNAEFGCIMKDGNLENMNACEDYEINPGFGTSQVIQDAVSGTVETDPKITSLKLKGWN